MTSSEWNVPRLRVKDILDVGLTYMVRKVFSRAIFWQFFSKILTLKLEQYQKGSFLTPKIPHISAPTFFFENRALLLVINFPEESLCKKSKKSLEPFSVTEGDRLTNCNVLKDLLNFSVFFDFLGFWKFQNWKCWKVEKLDNLKCCY